MASLRALRARVDDLQGPGKGAVVPSAAVVQDVKRVITWYQVVTNCPLYNEVVQVVYCVYEVPAVCVFHGWVEFVYLTAVSPGVVVNVSSKVAKDSLGRRVRVGVLVEDHRDRPVLSEEVYANYPGLQGAIATIGSAVAVRIGRSMAAQGRLEIARIPAGREDHFVLFREDVLTVMFVRPRRVAIAIFLSVRPSVREANVFYVFRVRASFANVHGVDAC